jgi:hypothetical protein
MSGKYDWQDPSIFDDPYTLYGRMREDDPLCWLPDAGGWAVTRHDDCARILADPDRFGKGFMRAPLAARFGAAVDAGPPANVDAGPPANVHAEPPANVHVEYFTRSLSFVDPPEHTALRDPADAALTRAVAEGYLRELEGAADELLDQLAGRGEADLQSELVDPLAFRGLTALLGVPAADRAKLRGWSPHLDLFFHAGFNFDDATMAEVDETLEELFGYFRHRLAAGGGEGDLPSRLAAAADRIGERQLLFLCLQLYGSGEITVSSLLGGGLLALLEHPEERRRLTADPTLPAADELMRYLTPVQIVNRQLRREVELRGQTLRPGDLLYVVLAAANRDPRVFDRPDRLDLGRPGADRHLALGAGPHHCWGATLARLAGDHLPRRILARLPGLELAGSPTWRRDSLFMRRPASLPVRWGG